MRVSKVWHLNPDRDKVLCRFINQREFEELEKSRSRIDISLSLDEAKLLWTIAFHDNAVTEVILKRLEACRVDGDMEQLAEDMNTLFNTLESSLYRKGISWPDYIDPSGG